MLLSLLLTLNIMICLALVAVVLLQRSEGGAFGSGSPTGLITTRGAGDLLTRTTWILFSIFLAISLALTLLGGRERSSQAILNRLKSQSINPDASPATTPPATSSPDTSTPPPLTPAQPSEPAPETTQSRGPALAAPKPRVRVAAGSSASQEGGLATGSPPPQSAPSVPKLISVTPPPASAGGAPATTGGAH